MKTTTELNQIRAQQALDKNRVRHNGIVMTSREFIETLSKEGYRPEIGQKPRIEYSRTKYNRMEGWQQEEYERKCSEMIPYYKAVGEDSSMPLEKYEYDYFLTLKPIPTKNETSSIITVNNAANIVDYWERNRDDSGVFLQFIDFDKVEVFLEDGSEGTIEDAIHDVKAVIYNANL